MNIYEKAFSAIQFQVSKLVMDADVEGQLVDYIEGVKDLAMMLDNREDLVNKKDFEKYLKFICKYGPRSTESVPQPASLTNEEES